MPEAYAPRDVNRHLPASVARLLTRLLQRSIQRTWIPVRWQRAYTEAIARIARMPAGVRAVPALLGGIPEVRMEGPASSPDRAVLYLHGGAYSVGSPRTHGAITGALALAAGAPIHVLDYRLSPEHPYPAALEDALAAYRDLVASGIDPERIVIAGDSSGAGLAVAAAMRLRDGDDPSPAGLALINGWFDITCKRPSIESNARRDAGLRADWAAGLGDAYRAEHDPRHPEISPVWGELAGLPPTYLQVGGDDLLLSDSEAFAKRAADAGVDVELRVFEGMWHDFQLAPELLAEGARAVEETGAAIRGFWGEGDAAGARADGAEVAASGNGRPTPTVAIVGAGFGGVGMGMTLKRAGIDSFTILEKGERIGGVWRDNTYPGAACDVPSHLYSYSFEPRPDWSRRYSPQPEILGYLEGCVERYRLEPHLRMGTEVAGASFDEEAGRWRVELTDGETLEADVVVSSCGQLSRPATRGIPGIDRFGGPIFHSARWDHDVELAGKRVAVIGTGASTIQIVPAIADRVGQLDLYQRSPPYVIPKKDRPYRSWERRLFRWAPLARRIERFRIWVTFEFFVSAFNQFKPLGRLGVRMFERLLEEQVADPELRRALTPDHVLGCKRVLISQDYYETLTRENVELITGGVRELTADGVVAEDGTERKADVVVLSTGFATNDFLAPMEIRGEGGRDLNEAWRAGAEAYLGIAVAGFPNLFLMYGPNTNLGSGSIIYQLESQMSYILDAVRTLQRTGARALAVRPEAQRRFTEEMEERLRDSVWMTGCNNWYVDEHGRNTNNWPGFTLEYRRRTKRLDPDDYELSRSP
jgi:cation diffusion facilitator CzcD-associated flavoprotein CzcO/acetyl esterase/lipase